ncbi:hypothetical protein AYX14_06091 [Cryptococcus neoformans]|nr:hypothetical protein AYX15_05980 [Cryptococcus neoformans var. grubii]OWZ65859.1 hypothetical protein AYX14_06091 [Cryptococcus neoformans var. grubii]
MSPANGGNVQAFAMPWAGNSSSYALVVRQQPERARLCSYKEENETIDRRPVDPPPVVELRVGSGREVTPEQLLESTSFFIRATTVASDPLTSASATSFTPSLFSSEPLTHTGPTYAPVKTPLGADATTGEVIQTPEKLRLLDGRMAALCIFAKISVRVPGIFRLKFTLFETTEHGIVELAQTVSEPFEVFSPKLFKGMHESTPLTRHLAAQGLKVKLRTDTTVGRQSVRRRRASANPTIPSTPTFIKEDVPAPMNIPPASSPHFLPTKSRLLPSLSAQAPSHSLSAQAPSHPEVPSSSSKVARRTVSDSPRNLVWRHAAYEIVRPHATENRVSGPGERPFTDDGSPISPNPVDWRVSAPSSDLSAFSLSRLHRVDPFRPPSVPNDTTSSASPQSYTPSSYSSTQLSSTQSLPTTPPPMTSSHSSIQSTLPTPRRSLGIDDGVPILPLPSSFNSPGHAEFVPPSVNQVLNPLRRSSTSSGPGLPEGHGSGAPSQSAAGPLTSRNRYLSASIPGPSSLRRPSPLTLPPLRPPPQEERSYERR